MNGKIWVESELGKGSNFIFEIDLIELEDRSVETSDTLLEEKSLKESINTLSGKKIREQNIGTPIIALSANTMKEDIEKSKDAGMIKHLSKPIDFELLYKMLLKYMTQKK